MRSDITCRPCLRDDIRPSVRRGSDGHDRPLRPTQCKTCAVKDGGRGEVGGGVVDGALVDRSVGRPAFVGQRCTERWRWRGSGSTVLWLRQCSVRSLRTTPLRRSMHATSTAAERGQVPEREAPGPSKKFWRVRPLGEPPTITTRQKFLRADPGLEAVERGWNELRPSALVTTPRTAPWGHSGLHF